MLQVVHRLLPSEAVKKIFARTFHQISYRFESRLSAVAFASPVAPPHNSSSNANPRQKTAGCHHPSLQGQNRSSSRGSSAQPDDRVAGTSTPGYQAEEEEEEDGSRVSKEDETASVSTSASSSHRTKSSCTETQDGCDGVEEGASPQEKSLKKNAGSESSKRGEAPFSGMKKGGEEREAHEDTENDVGKQRDSRREGTTKKSSGSGLTEQGEAAAAAGRGGEEEEDVVQEKIRHHLKRDVFLSPSAGESSSTSGEVYTSSTGERRGDRYCLDCIYLYESLCRYEELRIPLLHLVRDLTVACQKCWSISPGVLELMEARLPPCD